MNDIKDISTKALENELARRKAEEEERSSRARKEKTDLILANIDTILLFVPHARTSCSDENPVNETRCQRCFMLASKHHNYLSPDEDINITITNAV